MEIVNFFEKLSGRWFSQRTTHYLGAQQSKAGKSDLEIQWLTGADVAVQALCQQLAMPFEQALGGLQVKHSSTLEGNSQTQVGQSLLVPMVAVLSNNNESPVDGPTNDLLRESSPDPASGQLRGQLLWQGMTADGQPVISEYCFENDILTLTTTTAVARSQERWWFITDNLRLRTTLLTHQDGIELASFCSEIRLGGSPPPSQ